MSGGANSLWLTEWLAEAMTLRPGMRVLDLGCRRGASSIFLRREFGVEVWATDLWFSAAERLERVRDAGVDDGVFPISADARKLPLALGFFDAIVSIDSFPYYGTDDLYASFLAQFVKAGGPIGIAGAGLVREIQGGVPEHLRRWWEPAMCCLHSPEWWRQHWNRSCVLDVELADSMLDGWQVWLEWQRTACPDNSVEIEALAADAGRYVGYVRVIGRRRFDADLDQPLHRCRLSTRGSPYFVARRSTPGRAPDRPWAVTKSLPLGRSVERYLMPEPRRGRAMTRLCERWSIRAIESPLVVVRPAGDASWLPRSHSLEVAARPLRRSQLGVGVCRAGLE